ncbi:unnamed protein product [Sphagnum jensenii]|uniref:Uncharacterized protein n=1 Tax=Sphagnum jensenii TaxID=128206 RepID=A0ABP0VBE6_9BRYO
MSVMAAVVVRELGMMHLVTGSETYKTASGVVTHALGRIDEIPMKVGGVQCTMTFMRMNSEALMNEATTILKNTHVNDNSDWMPDQDSIIMPEEDDASTSELEAGTNGSEHCEWDSHQLK